MSRCSTAISAPPQAGEEPAGNGRYPALRANHARYDALGRLISATNNAANPWSQSFVYDGFGNLTQRTGSGTPLSIVVDGTNNRIANEIYDANGNWLASPGQTQNIYDIENRLWSAPTGSGWDSYWYSFRNERIRKGNVYIMYDLDGQVAGEYQRVFFGVNYGFSVEDPAKRRVYFGGRLIRIGAENVVTDRLGSVVRRGSTNYRYYPYGEQIGTPALTDSPAFATYTRDSSTGNDYALNRYYQRTNGRFSTADASGASNTLDPQSWNRYTYVQGDPINFQDPNGLDRMEACDPNNSRSYQIDPGCSTVKGAGSDGSGALRDTYDSIVWDVRMSVRRMENLVTYNPYFQWINNPSASFSTGNSPDVTSTVTFPTANEVNISPSAQSILGQAGRATGVLARPGTWAVLTAAAAGSVIAPGLAVDAAAYGSGFAMGLGGAISGSAGVVLGKYPVYLDQASKIGASAFSLPSWLWNSLNYMGSSWTINRAYIDAAAWSRQSIFLSSPIAGATGSYANELALLARKGITPIPLLP